MQPVYKQVLAVPKRRFDNDELGEEMRFRATWEFRALEIRFGQKNKSATWLETEDGLDLNWGEMMWPTVLSPCICQFDP